MLNQRYFAPVGQPTGRSQDAGWQGKGGGHQRHTARPTRYSQIPKPISQNKVIIIFPSTNKQDVIFNGNNNKMVGRSLGSSSSSSASHGPPPPPTHGPQPVVLDSKPFNQTEIVARPPETHTHRAMVKMHSTKAEGDVAHGWGKGSIRDTVYR